MKTVSRLLVALFALGGVSAGAVAAQNVYVDMNAGSPEPWDYVSPTLLSAMNAAFGANWSAVAYSAGFAGIFQADTRFVYLEGGAEHTEAMQNFIGANRSAVETWVAGGGHLFINAAGWGGTDNFDLGFGATWRYNHSDLAVATVAGHPIFNDPLRPTGFNWAGSNFSHNEILNGGTVLIEGDSGQDILTVKDWGSGMVMLGGQTSPYFHSPGAEAFNLRVNELAYVGAVPEPETYAMMLAGLGLLGAAARRKRDA